MGTEPPVFLQALLHPRSAWKKGLDKAVPLPGSVLLPVILNQIPKIRQSWVYPGAEREGLMGSIKYEGIFEIFLPRFKQKFPGILIPITGWEKKPHGK